MDGYRRIGGTVKRRTALLLVTLSWACVMWANPLQKKVEKRLQSASEVLQETMSAPDKGIPEEVMEGAKCIAVIPHEIRGGLVLGARYGKGVATCRTAKGWSAPAFFTITGGSWGAQVGLEGIDNILMIMDQKGMERLLSDKFQVGAQASAAAGPVGRHASAGTDWKLETEILSYARAKGAFVGASLDGAWVRPDNEAMLAVYGQDASARDVLRGSVPPPSSAHTFLAAVRSAELRAKKES
jgi:lipid-binding SYLF domain-containing protein